MKDTSWTNCTYSSIYSGCTYSDVSKQLFEKRQKQLGHIYKFMQPIFTSTFGETRKNGNMLHLTDKNGVVAFCSDFGYEGKVVRSLKYSGPEMLNILHKSNYLCVTAYEEIAGRKTEAFDGMWYVLRDLNGEPFAIIMNRINGKCSQDFIEKTYSCCQHVQAYVDNFFTQQAIIDSLPMGALICSLKGRVKQVNSIFDRIIGENIIEKNICSLPKTEWEDNGEPEYIKPLSILGHRVLSDTRIDHVGYRGREAQHVILLAATPETSIIHKASTMKSHRALDGIVGNSDEINAIKDTIMRIAKKPVSVLIQGESGTGKELIAKSIHDASGRKGRFVPINCGAIDRNLLQSELFGYEEGSFTGASKGGKKGKIELANSGTLFLDEIGEMPLDMQVSLLRVLEERSVMPLGGKVERKVDIRVVAATNRDLKSEIAKGNFRSDLYFRLAVIPIYLPPLRERREDISALAHMFVNRICDDYGLNDVLVTEDFYDSLSEYPWRGNVRELRNTLEYILLMSNGDTVNSRLLEKAMSTSTFTSEPIESVEKPEDPKKTEIMQALEACGFNKSKAAQMLGISRKTLYVRMAMYGLEL